MQIATYNVNGINDRLPVPLRWLDESSPDIVCLQELEAPQDRFPERAVAEAGYQAAWRGQKSWNGVAILGRVGDIHETRGGLPDEPPSARPRMNSTLAALPTWGDATYKMIDEAACNARSVSPAWATYAATRSSPSVSARATARLRSWASTSGLS